MVFRDNYNRKQIATHQSFRDRACARKINDLVAKEILEVVPNSKVVELGLERTTFRDYKSGFYLFYDYVYTPFHPEKGKEVVTAAFPKEGHAKSQLVAWAFNMRKEYFKNL